MPERVLRIGLDLKGSLESLGNSMDDLADALVATGGCELVRFRSAGPVGPGERRVLLRALWGPSWRRSRGRAVDEVIGPVDLVHVAGLATPPTNHVPLVVSVDDLRPLRGEAHTHHRVTQLRRALGRGATLVASSRAASHEVLEVLNAPRHRVVVVPPVVPLVEPTRDGQNLVVNVTGAVERVLDAKDELADLASRLDTRVIVLASQEAALRLRDVGTRIEVRPRSEARAALGSARSVLHLSDGARFPSFAVAALAAGVPTVARSTRINRELLGGAATLVEDDAQVVSALAESATSEARRSVLIAAGRDRAKDFAPGPAARAYLELYHQVVQGWSA